MKMVKLASKNTSGTPKVMSAELQQKLLNKTLNEAFEAGIVTDIGDAEGKFIFEHADKDIEAHYAIVNNYAVRVSDSVVEDIDNVEEYLGDLTFHAGISTIEGEGKGKAWFRLGKPAGIRLGDAVVAIAAEPVNEKK